MKIVVPIDFDEASETALRYTDAFTQNLNIEIVMVHALSKGTKESEAQEKYKELVRMGENIILDDAPWQIVMKKGNTLDLINELIEKERVVCVVLGSPELSEGVRAFSKQALHMISHAETPFLIVQKDYRISGKMNHIMVPIDLDSDDMRILEATAALAMPLGSEVHILASWKKDKSKLNLEHQIAEVAVDYFKERGVQAQVKYAPDTKHFDQYLIDYAQEVQSDLIALPHKGDSHFKRLLGKDFDRSVLLNKYNIPVFTLDPRCNFYFKDIRTLGKSS